MTFPRLLLLSTLAACAPPPRDNSGAPPPDLILPRSNARHLGRPREDIPGLPNFASVDGKLFRSGQPDASGFAAARELGVRTVVSLRSGHSDSDLLGGTGLWYARIPAHPWDPDADEVAMFMRLASDPRNQPVLVHCARGADRTGFMVAVYRIMVQGWSREDAIAELPNFGFDEIWWTLKRFLETFDPAELRRRMRSISAPRIEQIP